jgi:hypothetical protein
MSSAHVNGLRTNVSVSERTDVERKLFRIGQWIGILLRVPNAVSTD